MTSLKWLNERDWDGILASQLRRMTEDIAIDQLQNVDNIIEDYIECITGPS